MSGENVGDHIIRSLEEAQTKFEREIKNPEKAERAADKLEAELDRLTELLRGRP